MPARAAIVPAATCRRCIEDDALSDQIKAQLWGTHPVDVLLPFRCNASAEGDMSRSAIRWE